MHYPELFPHSLNNSKFIEWKLKCEFDREQFQEVASNVLFYACSPNRRITLLEANEIK